MNDFGGVSSVGSFRNQQDERYFSNKVMGVSRVAKFGWGGSKKPDIIAATAAKHETGSPIRPAVVSGVSAGLASRERAGSAQGWPSNAAGARV